MSHRSGNPARRVESTGLKIEAKHRYHAQIPEPKPGEHMWMVFGMWYVASPTADRFELDVENLVSIEGPGCFICERSCPGELR